jgi:hypothetical protein
MQKSYHKTKDHVKKKPRPAYQPSSPERNRVPRTDNRGKLSDFPYNYIRLLDKDVYIRCVMIRLSADTEKVSAAPVPLAVAVTRLLPLVVVVGEEDGLVADDGLDGGNGSALLRLTGAGDAEALAGLGPAGLEDVPGLAADVLDDLELTGDEVTGLVGGGAGVEVGVGVGTDDVDHLADGRDIVADPGRDDVGGGVETGVAGAAELALDADDEVAELGDGAVAVEHGLVTDDDHGDHVPLGPFLDGRDLLLDGGGCVVAALVADEDTGNDLDALGLAGGTDVGEGVAVGRVDTDGVDTGGLDGGDISHDLLGGLAETVDAVRGVSDTQVLATAELSVIAGGLGSLACRGGRNRGRSDVGRGGGRSNIGGSRGLGSRAGERAVEDGGSLNNGHNRRSGVGAGSVGLNDGDNDNGLLNNNSGDRSNGVSSGTGADVGGGRDNASGGIGADNGGGCRNNGRDTSKSVGSGRDSGGRSTADVLSLCHNYRCGRECVGAGSRAGLGNDRRGGCWRRGDRCRSRSRGGVCRGGVGIDAAAGGGNCRRCPDWFVLLANGVCRTGSVSFRVPRTTGRASDGAVDGGATWYTDCGIVPLCDLEQVMSMACVGMAASTDSSRQDRCRCCCHESRLHYE